ncbi:hypothetical protein RRG08_044672, partial [Elysia crispata]
GFAPSVQVAAVFEVRLQLMANRLFQTDYRLTQDRNPGKWEEGIVE